MLKLFGARALPLGNHQPGTLMGLRDEGCVIACGEGAVAFAEAQLPGRKRLPAKALMAGRALADGDLLC